MGTLKGKVCLVTGASRGVGKGIALGLGEAGATVYVTGRTIVEGDAMVPLSGTVGKTGEEIDQKGGKGIAIGCDHRNDADVEAVFGRIQQEQGKLDVLVNNAWAGYEGYVTGRHMPPGFSFWDKPISYWDDNLDGLRWSYVASWFAAKLMVAQRSGLIVNVSNRVPDPGDPAYDVAKSGTDRLTLDIAHQLRPHNVAVVSLYPGLVRTENVLFNAQYFDLSQSESPLFSGRAVAALAGDPQIMDKSGRGFVVADLAQEYGFSDDPD